MRDHIDWMLEALKALCVLGAAFLVVVLLTSAQMTLVIEDCEATGTYLWGDEVIECKVREVKP
jgi:hypothetical protein